MQTKTEIKKFLNSIKKQYPENLIARWSYILESRLKGLTYKQIGDELKITRQRVKQIETFLKKKNL